jgi:hypothetical protein
MVKWYNDCADMSEYVLSSSNYGLLSEGLQLAARSQDLMELLYALEGLHEVDDKKLTHC